MKLRNVFRLILLIVYLGFVGTNVNAQISSSDIAQLYEIPGNPPEGTLICFSPPTLSLCNRSYSSDILGVVTTKPAGAIINATPIENMVQVVNGGNSLLRVSNAAGNIASGDLLTSSDQEGVAVKSTRNGFVVGQALEAFSSDTEGTILVAINIHQAVSFTDVRSNLFELLRQGLSAAILTPLAVFRYSLSGLVIVLSFVLGFIYFGRVAQKGVEAIGRNPLASRRIQFNIILNLALMFGIFCIGLILSYFILTL